MTHVILKNVLYLQGQLPHPQQAPERAARAHGHLESRHVRCE